jgi:hypothetical protein
LFQIPAFYSRELDKVLSDPEADPILDRLLDAVAIAAELKQDILTAAFRVEHVSAGDLATVLHAILRRAISSSTVTTCGSDFATSLGST